MLLSSSLSGRNISVMQSHVLALAFPWDKDLWSSMVPDSPCGNSEDSYFKIVWQCILGFWQLVGLLGKDVRECGVALISISLSLESLRGQAARIITVWSRWGGGHTFRSISDEIKLTTTARKEFRFVGVHLGHSQSASSGRCAHSNNKWIWLICCFDCSHLKWDAYGKLCISRVSLDVLIRGNNVPGIYWLLDPRVAWLYDCDFGRDRMTGVRSHSVRWNSLLGGIRRSAVAFSSPWIWTNPVPAIPYLIRLGEESKIGIKKMC